MPLEDYTRKEAIGRGAFGSVYRARGPAGEVAVKLLTIQDAGRRKRFERELEMMLRLGREPGFVPVIEGGVEGAQAYLVMPLMSGGTLRQRLRAGRMPVDEALTLLARLADAMGTAHAEGVVHRDLKPENVLFDSDGRAFVADMGLARWVEGVGEESLGLSKSGQMRGTVGYMPPEQLRSAKSVGPSADVFALGAILHECLSGEPAFGADTVLAVVARIEEGKFERLDPRALGLTPALVRVVERCLQPDPARRFPHGSALAVALRAPETREASSPRLAPLVVALLLALLGLSGVGVALGLRLQAPVQRLDGGGDGLPPELRQALEGFRSLAWEGALGSEVGELGPNVGVFSLSDGGFLTTRLDLEAKTVATTRWSPEGVRAGSSRTLPVRSVRQVSSDGRVLWAMAPELQTVYEDGEAWREPLAGSNADTADARVFDGVAWWLGHRPGLEDAVGAAFVWRAEGQPLREAPFPDGVWRNGEVLFLGGPGRAVCVAARGESADPERHLIAWDLERGRELWRVRGLREQTHVRCSEAGGYVLSVEHPDRRISCYDGATGELQWRLPVEGEPRELIVLGETHCAYTSALSEVTVLRLADGEREARWTSVSGASSLVAHGEHLLLFSYAHGTVERRDWRSGASLWTLPLQRGEVLGVSGGDEELHVADALGVVRWRGGASERVASWGLELDHQPSTVELVVGVRWAVALLPRGGVWGTWAFPLDGRSPRQLEGLSGRYTPLHLEAGFLLAGSRDELVGYDLGAERVIWRHELGAANLALAAREADGAYLCALPSAELVRVGARDVQRVGLLPGRPERLALEVGSGRLAVAMDSGQVLVGTPRQLEPWGTLERSRDLAWHRGRLLGLDVYGLTVWEAGFVSERLNLNAVNSGGFRLWVDARERVYLGTEFGSVLVFAPR